MGTNWVHHGYNIRRLREILGMKQSALAKEMGPEWTQQAVSRLEAKAWIKPQIIEVVAKALDLLPNDILDFNEEVLLKNIRGQLLVYGAPGNPAPASRLDALMAENKALYEHLLRCEEDKNFLLKKIVAPLREENCQ